MIKLSDLIDPSLSNNTAALQDLFNKAAARNTPIVIDAGTWNHTGLVGANNLVLIGQGGTLKNTAASIAIDFTGKSGWKCRDVNLQGVATVDNSQAYPTISNTGTGIKVSGCDNFEWSGGKMSYIGTAIDYQSNADWGAKGRFLNIDIEYVYKAVYTNNSGEYALFSGLHVDKVTFGFHSDSGNNIFNNCQVARSGVAVKLSGGANNGHGQFMGCTFNHNNYALDVYEAVSIGETFVGCHFIGDVASPGNASKIRIYNSKGINLVGCHVGANITIDGGSGTQNGQNSINASLIRTDLPNYTAPVILNGGLGSFKNNTTLSGMWAANN